MLCIYFLITYLSARKLVGGRGFCCPSGLSCYFYLLLDINIDLNSETSTCTCTTLVCNFRLSNKWSSFRSGLIVGAWS